MSKIQIEPFVDVHVPTILELMNAEGWYYYDKNELSRYLKLKEACFVLKHDRHVIGCIFSTNYNNQTWLGNIVVHDDHRGRGYGQMMIDHTVDTLSDKGVKTFRLGSVPTAIGLYKKIGFKPEGFTTSQYVDVPLKVDIDKTAYDELVREITPGDLEEIARLDEKFFKADRLNLLKELYSDSVKPGSLCLEDNGKIAGFIMARRRLLSKTEASFAEGPDNVYRLGPSCVLPEYGIEGFKALFQRAIGAVNADAKTLPGISKMCVGFPINDDNLKLEKNDAQWNYMKGLGFKEEYFEQVMSYSPNGDASKTKADPEGIFAAATPGDKG